MPIQKKTAATLITRFKMAALSFPPENDQLLVLALSQRAVSEKHASLMVDAWIARSTEWPKPANIAQLSTEVPDPDSEIEKAKRTAARENCRFCQGSGFRFVAGEHGSTGAYPCNHQAPNERDGRMGVRMAPVVAVQYARDQREAVDRHDAWLRRRASTDQKGFPKITQAEVDALVAGRS